MNENVNYFTFISIYQVITRSFELYFNNFAPICKVTSVAWISSIVSSTILRFVFHQSFSNIDEDSDFRQIFASLALFLIVLVLVLFFVFSGLNAAITKIVYDTYTGIEIELGSVFQVAKENFFIIFVASLLKLFGIILAMIFPPISAALLASWYLHESATVVEGKGILDSLDRSWDVVSGYRLELLCTRATINIVISIIYSLLGLFFVLVGLLIPPSTVGYIIFQLVFTSIPFLVVIPLWYIVATVMYFNFRVVKEGLTRERLLSESGERGYNDIEMAVPVAKLTDHV